MRSEPTGRLRRGATRSWPAWIRAAVTRGGGRQGRGERRGIVAGCAPATGAPCREDAPWSAIRSVAGMCGLGMAAAAVDLAGNDGRTCQPSAAPLKKLQGRPSRSARATLPRVATCPVSWNPGHGRVWHGMCSLPESRPWLVEPWLRPGRVADLRHRVARVWRPVIPAGQPGVLGCAVFPRPAGRRMRINRRGAVRRRHL
jgi:hypothetical protein